MRTFDYSFLRTACLPSSILNLSMNISGLQSSTKFRKQSYDHIFHELEKIAKIQSIKSSNAIEGIITSESQFQQIVLQNRPPLDHNEAEIIGYRDALKEIHYAHESIDIRERDILRIHEIMLSFTGDSHKGHYKTEDNFILELDTNGNRSIRFRPTSAHETKQAMQQLELAYLEARDDAQINPLLLIPCVILDFLCIHPFQDGNGRISRLLTLLLLYRNGYDIGKYISFEEQINLRKDYYYESLKKSSMGWETNENSYIPFIENFLVTLNLCYCALDQRFSKNTGKLLTKKERIEATMEKSLVPLSKATICSMLPDVSPTTVEAVLGALVKEEKIQRLGKARASKYIKQYHS